MNFWAHYKNTNKKKDIFSGGNIEIHRYIIASKTKRK